MKVFSIKESKSQKKDQIDIVLSCAILLFLWQIIALKIDNDIYLPTINQVLYSMEEIVFSSRFYLDVILLINS